MPHRVVFDQTDVTKASLFKRLAALVYDLLVVIALLFLVGAIGVAFNEGEAVQGPLMQSAYFVTIFLFNGFFWTKSGQTIGMMAWRLRVQSLEGYSITWSQALKRWLAALLSLAALGLGYWWILLTDERLTWHDQLSNTRVVVTPKRKKAAS